MAGFGGRFVEEFGRPNRSTRLLVSVWIIIAALFLSDGIREHSAALTVVGSLAIVFFTLQIALWLVVARRAKGLR